MKTSGSQLYEFLVPNEMNKNRIPISNYTGFQPKQATAGHSSWDLITKLPRPISKFIVILKILGESFLVSKGCIHYLQVGS